VGFGVQGFAPAGGQVEVAPEGEGEEERALGGEGAEVRLVWVIGITTTSQKCEAVPRRAHRW